MSGKTSLGWTDATITSLHARLLVLLAEHSPVVRRHVLDDQLDVECACGNPIYTGHLIRLIVGVAGDEPLSSLPGRTTACASSTVASHAVAMPGPDTPAGQGNPTIGGAG